jgi:hypothetical protein
VNSEAWPTPSEGASREPLPRVEDLPVADRGYDQASVKAAFDSFYRHAAQLDAALRTLEAVDSFHRQASALRADLRTLRATGWTQQPFPASPAYGYDTRAPREGVSPAVWRLLGEIVFLIAVSVFLGVAKQPWWVIVGVMGGAFLIVAIIEWAASRDRWAAPAPARVPAHPLVEAQPAREQSGEDDEPIGWAAYEEAQEPSNAMTMIGASHETPAVEEPPHEIGATPADDKAAHVPEPEPVVEAAAEGDGEAEHEAPQPEPVASVDEPADGAEPDRRRRWWRRREPLSDEAAPSQEDAPRHVRVLAADGDAGAAAVDPWEQGFDAGPAASDSPPAAEPEEETGEHETPVAAEADPSRRRFRRR